MTRTPTEALIAVGDIASCASNGDEATAALLDGREGTIATLGDNVYERGTAAEFARCYEPSWGRHKRRTRPAAGNHDYAAADGAAYYAYFGAAAGEAGKGYYAYDIGSWRAIALNSNCAVVECGAGSAQHAWLRDELERNDARCTLAYWHHPRFSSGLHGPTASMAALYSLLYAAGADVVLAGHDHHYERFAPLNSDGAVDPERGIRNFVVGTGGRSLYPTVRALAGSEIKDTTSFGVLALFLRDDGYDWEFVPAAGSTFTDRGSASCH